MKDIKDRVCDRADDLVAFLYGELGEKDAREFERHLHECARCENEFAAFGQIRKSIVSWRDESLGAAWSTGTVNGPGFAPATIPAARTKPSAVTAIREFFNLSPMWMKGAAAFASILFCVFASLAVAHLIEKPKEPIVQIPAKESTEQLTSRIVQLQDELAHLKAVHGQDRPVKEVVAGTSSSRKPDKPNGFLATSGSATNARSLRKPLTQKERQELAADLGLLASRDEDDLDLVTDKISQSP